MLKELLITLAKNLVDHPDDVSVVESTDSEGGVLLELSVASDDMGKVIGRQGRIAKAIRLVMKAAGNKKNQRVTVEIVG